MANPYYFEKDRFPGYGDLWYLSVLHEADDPGGGLEMLGSLVERERRGFLFWKDEYPEPMLLTGSAVVLDAIKNLPGNPDPVRHQDLAGQTQSIRRRVSGSYQVEGGPFPGLPARLGIGVNYEDIENIDFQMGAGGRIYYIVGEYFDRLFHDSRIQGDSNTVHPLLEDNYVVDTLLLLNEYSVTAKFKSDLEADVSAKLTAVASIPSINGKAEYNKLDNRTISVTVKGGKDYVAALGVSRWDDFDKR